MVTRFLISNNKIAGLDVSFWKIVQKLGRVGRNPDDKSIFVFVKEKQLRGSGNDWIKIKVPN